MPAPSASLSVVTCTPHYAWLLVPERRGGMRARHQQRVRGYGGEGDHKGDNARAYEDQWIETNVVSEPLKPAVHQVDGRRPCDQVRPQYGFRELPQEHAQNVGPARAHGFADTDLLGALFGGMS